MKKIITVAAVGVLLGAGSVMAAGIPAGHGHAGGMMSAMDAAPFADLSATVSEADDYPAQDDAQAVIVHAQAVGQGGGAWADGIFLPPGYLHNGKDITEWMAQHAQHRSEGSAVPVPGALLLLGSGIAGLFLIRRVSMRNS